MLYCYNISGLVLPLVYQQIHVASYNISFIDTSLEAKVICLIDSSHSCHLDHLMSWRAAPKTEQLLLLHGPLVEYLIIIMQEKH